MKCLKSQIGISLIEVVVSLGLVSIVTMGFMGIMKSQLDGTSFIAAQTAANDVAWEATQILRNQAACNFNVNNLADKTIDLSDPADKINMADIRRPTSPGEPGVIVFTAGAETEDGALIESIELRDFEELVPGQYKAKMYLNMNISRSGHNKNFVRKINFSVSGTQVGTIVTLTDCLTGDPAPPQTY